MSFIGIVANSKNFELIKYYLCNGRKEIAYQIIHISPKSIENIKNIKFDLIVITSSIENISDKKEIIEKLCSKSKYLILNSDISIQLEFLKEEKVTVITYGLNQKSTVTISSIDEESVLIALQRNIKNIFEQNIEMGEKRILLDENNKLSPQNILVIFIIFLIYKENNL